RGRRHRVACPTRHPRPGTRARRRHGRRTPRRIPVRHRAGHRRRQCKRRRTPAHRAPATRRTAPHPPPRLLPTHRTRHRPSGSRSPRRAPHQSRRPGDHAVKWATRANIHIDRAACAWLIRHHIDPDADFVFITDPAEIPSDATPFDIRGVELSHHHGDCSFETILRRYELTDPVLWKIAEIIHEADLDDERYNAPEAPGLDITLRGLSMVCTDQQTLTHTTPVFDGLYEYYRRATLLGHEPA